MANAIEQAEEVIKGTTDWIAIPAAGIGYAEIAHSYRPGPEDGQPPDPSNGMNLTFVDLSLLPGYQGGMILGHKGPIENGWTGEESPAVFAYLDRLEPGDRVTVHRDGETVEYEVTGSFAREAGFRAAWQKPDGSLIVWDMRIANHIDAGASPLTLLTCHGIEKRDGYVERLWVTLRPVTMEVA